MPGLKAISAISVKFTITYSIREILLPDILVETLIKYKKAFCQNDTKKDFIFKWSKRKLETAIEKACNKTGVKRIRIHDLRHSHVSFLVNNNCNVSLVSKRLGHATKSITLDIYSHIFDNSQVELIENINSFIAEN